MKHLLHQIRKTLNIPTRGMRRKIKHDCEKIYDHAKEKRRARDRSIMESNDRNNSNCPKCGAGVDEIITKISGVRSVPVGWGSYCENVETLHCNECGNEWEKKGYSVRDWTMPVTEHDYVMMWVGDAKYCMTNGVEFFHDMESLKKYSAEGWYEAYCKAKNKAKWQADINSNLSTLRKCFPSVYEK